MSNLSNQRLTDEEFSARLNEFRAEAEFLEREAGLRRLLRCGAALGMAKIEAREAVEYSLPAWKFVRSDGTVGICAWCQREQGVARAPGESHTICPRHRDEQLAGVARIAAGEKAVVA